jgi:hypothetical protein
VNAAAVSDAALSDGAFSDAGNEVGGVAFSDAGNEVGGAAFSDAGNDTRGAASGEAGSETGGAASGDASRDATTGASTSGEALSSSTSHPPRLCLAVRTSLLCEFRTAAGVLQAFEVCPGQTTFGVLCSALSRMPGIEFPGHDPQAWFPRPSRFTFRGEVYEVTIPQENIRICPVDIGKAVIEMEELLEYVRHNVLRPRAARYTIR